MKQPNPVKYTYRGVHMLVIQMTSLNESLALKPTSSIIHLNIEQNLCLGYDKKQASTDRQ